MIWEDARRENLSPLVTGKKYNLIKNTASLAEQMCAKADKLIKAIK